MISSSEKINYSGMSLEKYEIARNLAAIGGNKEIISFIEQARKLYIHNTLLISPFRRIIYMRLPYTVDAIMLNYPVFAVARLYIKNLKTLLFIKSYR